jgi:tripartite-type tricarboxylate transporter receptor subunit TctC
LDLFIARSIETIDGLWPASRHAPGGFIVAVTRRDFLATAAAAGLAPTVGRASTYPSQELVWLIYQSPGGTVDISTRLIQPYIEPAGFKVRLEYATGAGGRIARNRLFAAKPDGYTVMTEVAPGAIVDELAYTVPYKGDSFEPIYGWANTGFQYCVRNDSPIHTFADFVAETRKRRVTVASIGRGGAQHLHIVAMRKQLGLNFDIVHFDGASPAYAALLGGHVDIGGGGPASGKRQGGGRLRFIGLTAEAREFPLLEVPTLREQGFDVTPVNQFFFASTSPGVPADRLALLTKVFGAAVARPEFVKAMEELGNTVTPLTPADIKVEHGRHRALILEFKEELKT